MKISVVIITYNESSNIARCLDAAKLVADEIIIVDSYSTDTTQQIVEKYDKVQFFQHQFEGYGEQKNWGNSKANGDYILSLDADEILSESLIQSILEIKKNPKLKAYRLNRLTNFAGTWVRYAGWYPDRKIRLWEKSSAVWVGKAVHEVLEVKENVKIGQLKGDLLHYSFDSIFDYFQRQNKYNKLSVVERLKRGKTPKFWSSLIKGFFKFIGLYFFRLGFLHGFHGFVICLFGAGKYLMYYAKYQQIIKEKTATKTVNGLPKHLQNSSSWSFLNPLKLRKLIKYYKRENIKTIEFNNYNDLKLGGIAAFWTGIPNVVFRSDEVLPKGVFDDFLMTTVVTTKN
ncbi:MAG: glycosyltransferase family 2 protein [Saprospiraceae bacterium]